MVAGLDAQMQSAEYAEWYVEQVEYAFRSQPHLYEAFLQLLHMHQGELLSIDAVIAQASLRNVLALEKHRTVGVSGYCLRVFWTP